MRAIVIEQSITNRTTVLEKYLNDINHLPLLSVDDEIRLSALIKKGDKNAVDKLVQGNLRFVVSVAKRYQNQGMSLEDLICEGNLGLIKAAERFDATRGFKFISFAVWWIRQAIMHSLTEKRRMIRLPANKVNELSRVHSVTAQLEQQLERAPTVEELAEILDLPAEKIREARYEMAHTVSIDKESGEDNEFTLKDILADSNAPEADLEMMNESMSTNARRLLVYLRPRERKVLELHFGLSGLSPMGLEEIATYLNMSKEGVRQIKCRALERLREKLDGNAFDYLLR